jgi:hypothetical protein
VEAAWTVNVAQVRREGIGVTLPGHPAVLHPPEDIQLLTGDENLLAAKAIVNIASRSLLTTCAASTITKTHSCAPSSRRP